ncbi:MAG TPA: DNA polymerase III subunit delta [Tepidisphaeraceae bacterium]|jgi:DNA polymerase III delta subunit
MAKPVYALVGEDSFLQLQELGRIVRELPADTQRTDYDGEQAQLAEVLDDLRSFAMFGGGKLVVVRAADDFVSRYREQVENYLAAPSDSATLVLRMNSLPKVQRVYKLITKVGEVVECSPPKDLAKWAIEHAKKTQGVTMTLDAAKLLAELIGDDMGKLDTEIAKLALCADDQKITPEVVDENVTNQRDREMKELTAAIASGDTAEALRRWQELLRSDPSSEFRAVTWLAMWLEDVRLFLKNPGAAGKLMWKYRNIDAFKRVANGIGKQGLPRLVDQLAEVDFHSKTGVGDFAENVERFILSLEVK